MWATYEGLLRADFQLFDEHPVEAVKLFCWTLCFLLFMQRKGMTRNASYMATSSSALINSYQAPQLGDEPLRGIRAHVTSAKDDSRITPTLVQTWKQLLGEGESLTTASVPGHHLFVFDPASKAAWLDMVVADLERLQG